MTTTTKRTGRRPLGVRIHLNVPPWIISQAEALAAHRTKLVRREPPRGSGPDAPAVSRADVVRDVLRAGLGSLAEQGVVAPGFNPGKAMRDAERAGGPV